MKPRSAFARFEQSLAAERKAVTEKDIEAGVVEAPKLKKRPPAIAMGRPRGPRVKPDGLTTIELSVDPKFTAAAALTAARKGSTTAEVMAMWLETLAFADEPQNPCPPIVTFTMHLTVGPDAFPEDVFEQLRDAAERMGVSPSRLATGIVKQALADGRLNRERATLS